MKIEVLYFADFKDIIGKDKEIYELNDSSLKDFVNLLFNKYPSIKDLIWEDYTDNIKRSVKIAINDEIVFSEKLLNIKLSEGDRLAFILPISGG